MFVHVTRYMAKAARSVIKEVTCERCGCAYVYEMRRAAQGDALGSGTGAVAQQRAQQTVEKQLQRKTDPARCPDCGQLQRAMVRDLAWRYSKYPLISLTMGGIGIGVGWMIYAGSGPAQRPSLLACFLPQAVIMVMSLVAFVIAQMYPYNEKKRFGRKVETVRAKEWRAGGVTTFLVPRVTADGWISVRPSILSFPPKCVSCNGAAKKTVMGRIAGWYFRAPVCGGCWWRVVGKRFGSVAGLWLTLAAPAVALAAIFDRGEIGKIAGLLCAAAGLVAIPSGFLLFRYRGMPFRTSGVVADADRAAIRFRDEACGRDFVAHAIEAAANRAVPATAFAGV